MQIYFWVTLRVQFKTGTRHLLILQEIVITVRLMPDFSQCAGELAYLFSYWGRLGDVEQGAVELLR